jgi:hypothetical protein
MAIGLQLALIGIGAGAAAALLFASVLSGSLLSVFLFYLAPLPIMIAALGWSHWAGLVAALVAALGLTVAFGTFFFPAFLIGIGLPAWWLAYLALLARPQGDGQILQWYPPGRLVAWAAILGALVIIVSIPQFGGDAATVQATLRTSFERMFRLQFRIPADDPLVIPGLGDASGAINVLVIALPPMAAVVTTITQIFNLWLAARIVSVSGRLRRPWPDLGSLHLPPATPFMLAAGVAGALLLPDLLGVCAGLFAATLLIAYALLGFSVLHGLTRHLQARGVVLVGVYTAVLLLGWPVLLMMMLLGLIDTALDLRARVATRGPPAPLS